MMARLRGNVGVPSATPYVPVDELASTMDAYPSGLADAAATEAQPPMEWPSRPMFFESTMSSERRYLRVSSPPNPAANAGGSENPWPD